MNQEQAANFQRALTDEGKLIEAGWESFRWMVIPVGAPEIQVREMRGAFFAGAVQLFSSLMSILEPGAEPTDADLGRMDAISKELKGHLNAMRHASAEATGSTS